MIDVSEQIRNLELKKKWCLRKGYINYAKIIDKQLIELKLRRLPIIPDLAEDYKKDGLL